MDGFKAYFSSALELHTQTGKHAEVAKTGEFKCDINKLTYGGIGFVMHVGKSLGAWLLYSTGGLVGKTYVAIRSCSPLPMAHCVVMCTCTAHLRTQIQIPKSNNNNKT